MAAAGHAGWIVQAGQNRFTLNRSVGGTVDNLGFAADAGTIQCVSQRQ